MKACELTRTRPYLTISYFTRPYSTRPYFIRPFSTRPSLPDLNLQYLISPELTLPDLTLPYLTLPYLTLPDLTIPDLSLPDLTIPGLTLPDLSLPYLTLPDLTLHLIQNEMKFQHLITHNNYFTENGYNVIKSRSCVFAAKEPNGCRKDLKNRILKVFLDCSGIFGSFRYFWIFLIY
jgi:hypothetical protein